VALSRRELPVLDLVGRRLQRLALMRYSQALRLVPSWNWWNAANALTKVSWTRSSASAGLRVIRMAAA